jgi:curved DNA-binding protein CbpA
MDLDPYELLGVTVDATPREINEARKYADRVLGEISRGLGPEMAAAKSAEIEQAWRTLSNADERAAVDERLRAIRPADSLIGSDFSKSNGHPGKICSLCNAAPAMTMHYRVRRSKKVVESISGMFCRTCGIATFRDATNQTLRQGFWRARTIITTMAIVQGNWRERRRISVLKQSDDTYLSLDPGRPLWLRSGVVTLTISILVFVTSVAQVADIGSMLSSKKSPLAPLNQLNIP